MTDPAEEAEAPPPAEPITVRLDATDADVDHPAGVALQLPDAATLASGTRVTVLPSALRRGGVLRRLLGPSRVPVSRATRCSALLLRGYVDIGADDDHAWGVAP